MSASEIARLESDPLRTAANSALSGLDGKALLSKAMREVFPRRVAVVSSFGVESAVLLDLVARVDPATPVLFLETGMHFPETAAYRTVLTDRLGLRDVRLVRPDDADRAQTDPDNALWRRDADRCCALRKVRPLDRALAGFDAWISGRKRYHGGARAALAPIEWERDGAGGVRLKLNPLAGWSAEQIDAYFDRHALPRHPLWAAGYPSVGCAPCTAKPPPGPVDDRAEFLRHAQIDVALEGDDQIGQPVERRPAPLGKFRLVRRKIDVRIGPEETQREPLLGLAAIAALPDTARQGRRQVVGVPGRALGQEVGLVGSDAHLLAQFAPGGLDRGLPLVDAALRHLPMVAGRVDPVADEDVAGRIHQHQADAFAVGAGVLGRAHHPD
eukprot:g197.t1